MKVDSFMVGTKVEDVIRLNSVVSKELVDHLFLLISSQLLIEIARTVSFLENHLGETSFNKVQVQLVLFLLISSLSWFEVTYTMAFISVLLEDHNPRYVLPYKCQNNRFNAFKKTCFGVYYEHVDKD